MSAYLDVNIVANSRFDGKWLKTDLQETIRRPQLAAAWNELIKDGELFGDFSESLLNSAGALAHKGTIFNIFKIRIHCQPLQIRCMLWSECSSVSISTFC